MEDRLYRELKTKAGEPIRVRKFADVFIVELKSPVHGRWVALANYPSLQEAGREIANWVYGRE